MYLNKVFLYGNLTRDPELKALPSGQQMASFGLATNRSYKDKNGQKQEATEFHNIVAFGRPAEVIAQYMKKGRPLYVEGRIQTRSWESEGQKKYRTEVIVENFQFGDSGRGPASPASGLPKGNEGQSADAAGNDGGEAIKYPDEEINPEDIPF
ncbi:MAG: single-stranded DNA-binding protein [bacterium]|nr:single-stranded DNA-binding protein [bacterium]MDO8742343.1 single-stranded DNA-binding protein [bacterium]